MLKIHLKLVSKPKKISSLLVIVLGEKVNYKTKILIWNDKLIVFEAIF